jgi:acetoin:2,6-dichlorophenolindophenol oxidoreductase subunit beta
MEFTMQPNQSLTVKQSVLESLNAGLHQAFSADARVILLGEDILDPYGGAFKVTSGLSTAYPDRVWSTPISEAGVIGIAAGMAMRGLFPVVEIMFGDFLTLAADQIINHIVKFPWMYSGGKAPAEQVIAPLVIRTPMGGRRGYGPTHSQTLEKMFLGVPGLRVVAPTNLTDSAQNSPGGLLAQAILRDHEPVLFVENKLLYLLPVQIPDNLTDWEVVTFLPVDHPGYPTYTITLRGAPPAQVSLTAYGYMAELARQAAYRLAIEFEIFTELVIPTQLAPFQMAPLFDSLRRTGRLFTVEEGSFTLGWGAEILARCTEQTGINLRTARRLAGQDLPIPASGPLEAAILPGVDQIIERCLELVQNR